MSTRTKARMTATTTTPVCPYCDAPLCVDAASYLTCVDERCTEAGESWTLDDVRILGENNAERSAQRMIERQAARYLDGEGDSPSYRASMIDAGRGRLR